MNAHNIYIYIHIIYICKIICLGSAYPTVPVPTNSPPFMMFQGGAAVKAKPKMNKSV